MVGYGEAYLPAELPRKRAMVYENMTRDADDRPAAHRVEAVHYRAADARPVSANSAIELNARL
jgi:hypothetical protein